MLGLGLGLGLDLCGRIAAVWAVVARGPCRASRNRVCTYSVRAMWRASVILTILYYDCTRYCKAHPCARYSRSLYYHTSARYWVRYTCARSHATR